MRGGVREVVKTATLEIKEAAATGFLAAFPRFDAVRTADG